MSAYIVIIFMALTMIGFLAKISALFTALEMHEEIPSYRLLEGLLWIQIIQTFGEFFAYLIDPSFWLADHMIRLYYITTFSTMVLTPFIVSRIINLKIHKLIYFIGFIFLALTIYLTYFSDLIIAGVSHTGINLTRVGGPFYWIFQLTVFASIGFTFNILIRANKNQEGLTKLKSKNITITYSLYAGYIIGIVALMIFFKGINATGILPIFMGILMLCLAKSISNKKILDLTYWLPFSKRRRLINRLVKPFITVYDDGLDIDIKKEYDNIVAMHALQLFNGNQTKAAVWLKSSQSWVSRREQSRTH